MGLPRPPSDAEVGDALNTKISTRMINLGPLGPQGNPRPRGIPDPRRPPRAPRGSPWPMAAPKPPSDLQVAGALSTKMQEDFKPESRGPPRDPQAQGNSKQETPKGSQGIPMPHGRPQAPKRSSGCGRPKYKNVYEAYKAGSPGPPGNPKTQVNPDRRPPRAPRGSPGPMGPPPQAPTRSEVVDALNKTYTKGF